MDGGWNEFIFIWRIENYSYCWHKNGEKLLSPRFVADGLDGTAWNLLLCPRGWTDKNMGYISFYLYRNASDEGPESVSVRCELSALEADGSGNIFGMQFEHSYKKGHGQGWTSFFSRNEVFSQRKSDYLPQDTLTVCCIIGKRGGIARKVVGQCSARTRIRVEKISFLHAVERFSTLQPYVKHTIDIRSPSKENGFISSSLYFTEGLCCEEKIMIEISSCYTNHFLCICELYLLDKTGSEIECYKADNRYDAEGKIIRTFPLFLTKKQVLNKKCEFLPDDQLSLQCECIFSAGLEFQAIEETIHNIPLPALKLNRYRISNKNANDTAGTVSTYPGVSEDMKALYETQCLADVELQTETKSFPAHKTVLCARSPVFKVMLTNEMKEKNTNCIRVDDLENDVVQQLLVFLYSGTVEKLEWENATKLYYAADKCQVGRLKSMCSSFFMENLTPNNAGELLLLADTHSDNNLKTLVENFILEYHEEVFGSEEWRTLTVSHPLLVAKTMVLRYKGERK